MYLDLNCAACSQLINCCKSRFARRYRPLKWGERFAIQHAAHCIDHRAGDLTICDVGDHLLDRLRVSTKIKNRRDTVPRKFCDIETTVPGASDMHMHVPQPGHEVLVTAVNSLNSIKRNTSFRLNRYKDAVPDGNCRYARLGTSTRINCDVLDYQVRWNRWAFAAHDEHDDRDKWKSSQIRNSSAERR